MDSGKIISLFVEAAVNDPQISAYHVSVYVALVHRSLLLDGAMSFRVFSREILPFAKVSKPGTYHQILSDLARQGYIKYDASHSSVTGSMVTLVPLNP